MVKNKKLATILKENKRSPGELIEVLQDIQEAFNFLPEDALRETADKLNVPLIEVFRVANFYKAFTLQPRGKHLLTTCMGTACHVRGAPRLLDEICSLLKVQPGETTANGKFTVETVNCLGACALGPVVILDGKYYDHISSAKLTALIEKVSRKPGKKQKRK
ncbi:NAD(P)H-dependent oxidoreductase subunit E [Candidatus Omnitrophota bacterium]